MKNWLMIMGAAVAALQWVLLRAIGFHAEPLVVAALSGIAILGAAFLLSWAAEVAQMDISQALALALLSLIAVLPEYAVDMYFAWMAGKEPSYASFAVANMTGANRLLIGVGWSAVVFLFWWRKRASLQLDRSHSLELATLTLATAYALFIPLKGNISLLDAAVLLGLFALYLLATSRTAREEPELVGPAEAIGNLAKGRRRSVTAVLFLCAAAAIFAAAEPFSESLLATGRMLQIEQFILVQWLAPLTSEAPEFIVAALFVLRGHPEMGLRTMIASKVNQWTLLVGMLPLVYSFSLGQASGLPLDGRQTEELFLTAAQSAFAVVLLSRFAISARGALLLFALFATQLAIPSTEARYLFSFLYLGLALLFLIDGKRRANLANAPLRLLECLVKRS